MKPQIRGISSSNPQVELDPKLAGPNEYIQQNIETLNHICQSFLNAIVDSIPECPRPMRVICRHIYFEIRKKFSEDVGKSGLVGFFFLRFFVPSLIDKEILGGNLVYFFSLSFIDQKMGKILDRHQKQYQDVLHLSLKH
jgi:hypothetical protein